MVEQGLSLDAVFGSLADPTRRDILVRLMQRELTVSQVAAPYDMSLAAVSKHLKTLEQAKLIIKRRHGKQQLVRPRPVAMVQANEYLRQFEALWEDRFDRLETYLGETEG